MTEVKVTGVATNGNPTTGVLEDPNPNLRANLNPQFVAKSILILALEEDIEEPGDFRQVGPTKSEHRMAMERALGELKVGAIVSQVVPDRALAYKLRALVSSCRKYLVDSDPKFKDLHFKTDARPYGADGGTQWKVKIKRVG